MTEEMTPEPQVDTEVRATSNMPDGPTELAAVEAPGEQQLNPPPREATDGEEKPKKKPEPAYKFDPRNAIYKRRSEKQAESQRQSDEVFDAGRQAAGLPREEPATPATESVASGDEMVTIKVYGEERQAPKAEIEKAGGVAAYQKAVAADVKLEQAARREAAVKAEEARLLRIASNLKNGLDENGEPIAAKPPTSGVPPAISQEALEATVKSLYSGDTEEAVGALRTLVTQISGRQGTGNEVSPEIVRAVETRVLERMDERDTLRDEEKDVNEANRIFREDFKDIAADPALMVWAKGLASTLTADPENQGKSRAQIARMVGAEIHKKIGKAPTVSEVDRRRSLKETLPPPSSGSGRVPNAEPKRFPSNAEYVQQLRRNSGSNSAPR